MGGSKSRCDGAQTPSHRLARKPPYRSAGPNREDTILRGEEPCDPERGSQMPRKSRSSSQIQRHTIVKRTPRPRPRVLHVRPTFPAVVVGEDGRVSGARTAADAVDAAERMLVDQLFAEGKHLAVIAKVAAAAAVGARVR
jgi:hypothetical protein